MSHPTSKDHNLNSGKGWGYLLGVGLIGFVLNSFLSTDSSNFKGTKSTESRYTVGAMNRGQQAYWLEHNTFGQSLEALEIGVHPESRNYRYFTQSLENAAFQYAISLHPELFKRKPGKIWGIFPLRGKDYALPSYLGVVWVKPNPNNDSEATQNDVQIFSILCESTYPYLLVESFQPSSQHGDFRCPEGMKTWVKPK